MENIERPNVSPMRGTAEGELVKDSLRGDKQRLRLPMRSHCGHRRRLDLHGLDIEVQEGP
jgi:hypothetical protein